MTADDLSIHPDCRLSIADINRFLSHVDVDEETGAWLWRGGKTGSGYGAFWWKTKTLLAHRVSHEIKHGAIKEGLFVCHKNEGLGRDNVNPDHLFLGSGHDNMADASRKGRLPHGSRNAASKLTEQQVLEILESPLSQTQLAKVYGVSSATVSHIRRGDQWTKATGMEPVTTHSLRNKTGYRGVRVSNGKYEASITRRINGKVKTKYLGRFDDPVRAAKAFDKAALEADGPEARVNFPKPG